MIKRNQGRLVTIASAPGLTDYAASKYAALGFMESLRAKLRDQNSAVTALTACPSLAKNSRRTTKRQENPRRD
jgi:all-trans-retinol dehydrogenase (NAD+)